DGGPHMPVGRASRPHLSRPARPNKSTTKFSAAFDDDEEISEDSKKELAELEEAAKKVPAFDIPAGFTFAKDVRAMKWYILAASTHIISFAYPYPTNQAKRPGDYVAVFRHQSIV
ncbi:hypothetical protein MPER_03921, partial [Moniliophthora perniciosa FA553]